MSNLILDSQECGDDYFTKCQYCGELYLLKKVSDEWRDECSHHGCNNFAAPSRHFDTDDPIIVCYSCGHVKGDVVESDLDDSIVKRIMFSSTQRNKAPLARCKRCIANNVTTRYAPFHHLLQDNSLGAQLHDAISDINIDKV